MFQFSAISAITDGRFNSVTSFSQAISHYIPLILSTSIVYFSISAEVFHIRKNLNKQDDKQNRKTCNLYNCKDTVYDCNANIIIFCRNSLSPLIF